MVLGKACLQKSQQVKLCPRCAGSGSTATLRCLRGSKAGGMWRSALEKETGRAMNLTVLAGTVERCKL